MIFVGTIIWIANICDVLVIQYIFLNVVIVEQLVIKLIYNFTYVLVYVLKVLSRHLKYSIENNYKIHLMMKIILRKWRAYLSSSVLTICAMFSFRSSLYRLLKSIKNFRICSPPPPNSENEDVDSSEYYS